MALTFVLGVSMQSFFNFFQNHKILAFFLLVFLLFWLSFFLSYLFFLLKSRREGVPPPPKGSRRSPRKISLWKNLFVLLPARLVADYNSRNPDAFSHKGVIIFTGRQGKGKTIAMAKQILDWQYEFPLCKVITNFAYTKQDDELKHWRQLTDYSNGVYGVIAAMDETQNWFSSNQSKDFPPEMLQVVTQNRKNRRVILGTAQSFNRLSKPLREQTTEVRKCMTFFGALTVVIRQEPEVDAVSGDVLRYRYLGMYYFVHTDEIRNCFDTYRVIESLSSSGFQPRAPLNSAAVGDAPRLVVSAPRRKV